MVYPVRQYVDDSGLHAHYRSIGLDLVKRCWSKYLEVKPWRILRRLNLINNVLNKYRGEGNEVCWLFFANKKNKTQPKLSDRASIYDIHHVDRVLSAGVTYEELNMQKKYPNQREVLGQINDLKQLVVGGFHTSDCVAGFCDAARQLGIDSRVDSFLTESGLHTLIHTFQFDLDAQLIKKGTLDPEMHEDDPEEIKQMITEGRFTAEELRL